MFWNTDTICHGNLYPFDFVTLSPILNLGIVNEIGNKRQEPREQNYIYERIASYHYCFNHIYKL